MVAIQFAVFALMACKGLADNNPPGMTQACVAAQKEAFAPQISSAMTDPAKRLCASKGDAMCQSNQMLGFGCDIASQNETMGHLISDGVCTQADQVKTKDISGDFAQLAVCGKCHNVSVDLYIKHTATCGFPPVWTKFLHACSDMFKTVCVPCAEDEACSAQAAQAAHAARAALRSGDSFSCRIARDKLRVAHCEFRVAEQEPNTYAGLSTRDELRVANDLKVKLAHSKIETARDQVSHYCADQSESPHDRCEDSSESLSAGHKPANSGMAGVVLGCVCVAAASFAVATLAMRRYRRPEVSMEPLLLG